MTARYLTSQLKQYFAHLALADPGFCPDPIDLSLGADVFSQITDRTWVSVILYLLYSGIVWVDYYWTS